MNYRSEGRGRRRWWTFTGLLLVFGFGWFPTSLAQRPAQGPMSSTRQTPEEMGYELVWKDDFNGTALAPNKWEVRGIGP